MRRRRFLKLLSWTTASGFCSAELFANQHYNVDSAQRKNSVDTSTKDIQLEMFMPDLVLGHRLRDREMILNAWQTAPQKSTTEILIAGAGVAGLSCAYHLKKMNRQFTIIDPLDRPGGTSASIFCGDLQVPIGAHYLMTPPSEAVELRNFLTEIGAIQDHVDGLDIYNPKFLLDNSKNVERSFYKGRWIDGIGDSLGDLPQSTALRKFHRLARFLSQIEGDDKRRWFSIPTEKSSHDQKALELFNINFVEYLKKAKIWDKQVEYVVNYACMDDYGCLAHEVSAWLGWHYFACRPYLNLSQTLTSSSGNGWLVEAMQKQIPQESKIWSTVLAGIRKHKQGIECLLTDHQGNWWRQVCSKLIYAGKNHALKYLCNEPWYQQKLEEIAPLLLKNQKQWLTTQIKFENLPTELANQMHWDNVDIDSQSVGYIHANHQNFNPKDSQVLTHYLPVSAKLGWHNKELFNQSPAQLKQLIIDDLYHSSPELVPYIAKMIFRPAGHAMSIPAKNQPLPSLINGQNSPEISDLILCNSDSYGLPLFEEAFQAGYNASQKIAKIR